MEVTLATGLYGNGVKVVRRKLFVLVSCILPLLAESVIGVADGASENTAIPAIDALFDEYTKSEVVGQTGSPGCSLGVIHHGQFVYRRGYGLANLEHHRPLDQHSIFRIGSTSKQFTAMAIALLAESQQIDLDDRLRRYFPEFPTWADEVTIRQLVYHTSGVRDYLQLAYLAGKGDDVDHYTDQWVIDLLARQQQTNFPPGTQYLYSNSGYLLLAHLVERVTGQTLREYAAAHLFAPLGMQSTHFHDDHTEIVPLRASGYAPDDQGFRLSMTTLDIVGDGAVFTSVDELLLWDRNFYANQLGEGNPALIEQITTPGRLNDGTAIDYAFGLGIDEYRGLRRVSHDGAFVGYRAEMARFPEQSFTVIVLCNRADANPGGLAMRIANHFLEDEFTESAPTLGTDVSTARPASNEFFVEPGELNRYAGDFWEPVEGFAAETQVINEKLWAVHSPTRRNEMMPIGRNQFRMLGIPADVIVSFEMDQGRIVRMSRTINGEARGEFIPFERRQISAAELSAYAGTYYSPELDTRYWLRMHDQQLVFQFDDEPPQPLTALFAETFENPDYGAFMFQRDKNGEITGFELHSDGVRNLQFVRRGAVPKDDSES